MISFNLIKTFSKLNFTHISQRNLINPATSPLSILRRKTGLSYSLCREALNKNSDDVEQSENWLKAYALTHGMERASKLTYRTAKEGLIGLSTSKNSKAVSFVEINCETDFVAKNQIFKDFALATACKFPPPNQDLTLRVDDVNDINHIRFNINEIETITKDIGELVTRLGENVKLGRAWHIFTNEHNLNLFAQVHGKIACSNNKEGTQTVVGRYGAVICLKNIDQDVSIGSKKLSEVGNRLCTHVLGYNPEYIELPISIRKQYEEMSREKQNEPEVNALVEETNDCALVDQDELFEDQPEKNPKDDWPSLMDQTLIMSDEIDVRTFCKDNNVEVVFFKRLECGKDDNE